MYWLETIKFDDRFASTITVDIGIDPLTYRSNHMKVIRFQTVNFLLTKLKDTLVPQP